MDNDLGHIGRNRYIREKCSGSSRFVTKIYKSVDQASKTHRYVDCGEAEHGDGSEQNNLVHMRCLLLIPCDEEVGEKEEDIDA
jgi:hypothetical protein